MSIDLPLDQMTSAEKIAMMELLWADLSRDSTTVASPPWHREVLEERKRLLGEGKLRFLDWDSAISDLREELRGNSSP
jgi:hypothetical protein